MEKSPLEVLGMIGLLLVFFGGWGFLVGGILWTNRALRTAFEALAAKYGLELEFQMVGRLFRHPSAVGIVRDRELRITTEMHARTLLDGTQKNLSACTRVGVTRARPGCPSIGLRPPGLLRRGTRHPTGDPEFDRAWFVKAADPTGLLEVLGPSVRSRLVECRRLGMDGELGVNDHAVWYEEGRTVTTRRRLARFERIVDLLLEL